MTSLTPNPKADTVIIISTRANERRALRVGWFDLRIGGKPCRLEANRLLEPGVDEKSVSIFFRDATTGTESYGVGRYVDPEPTDDGRWMLDFNERLQPRVRDEPLLQLPAAPARQHAEGGDAGRREGLALRALRRGPWAGCPVPAASPAPRRPREARGAAPG